MNNVPAESEYVGEDEISLEPVIQYLQSEQGHEIASRALTIVEDIKKSTLERTSSHAKFEKWLQVGIIMLVIAASTWLTYVDKFDATIGVLFGTLVGYLFGRK